MRIPINSTFTKEISKKFQRVFNPQTTFEEIQNLQEESIMGSHVDNFLNEVQNKDTKNAQSYEKEYKMNTPKQVFIQTYIDQDFFSGKNLKSKGRIIHGATNMTEASRIVDTKYPNIDKKFTTLSLLEYIDGKCQ